MFEEWLDALATEAPTPGAGSAAAVTTAAAAALVEMAARRSIGEWSEAEGAVAQAVALRDRATRLAAENDAAYGRATLALRGDGAEPGPQRDFLLGQAIRDSADVPVRIAAAAADVALLANGVADHCVPAARGDALAAAGLAAGAAEAARTLVAINLTVTPGDARITGAENSASRARRAGERSG